MRKFILAILLLSANLALSQTPDRYAFIERTHSSLRATDVDSVRLRLLLRLANVYKFNRPDSGIFYSTKAMQLARESKSIGRELQAYNFLALSHQTLGDYSKSLKITLEALRRYDAEEKNIDPENRSSQGTFNLLLGSNYYELRDYENALKYYKISRSFYDQYENKPFSSVSRSFIAITHAKLNHYDSALHLAHIARDMGDSLGFSWVQRVNLGRLAAIHEEKGNLDSAGFYLQKILSLFTISEIYEANYSAFLPLARVKKNLGDFDSAYYYAKRYEDFTTKNRLYQDVVQVSDLLSELLEESDPKLALKYSRQANAYQDSLARFSQTTFFEDFIDFDEQQRQLAIAQAKKEYSNQLRTNILIVGLIILVIIAYVLYRNNRNKQRAKTRIEEAYDKLKATQSQLIHSEKMASLGELTAGIAHEIQNPLNFVNNFSELSEELLEELHEEATSGNVNGVREIVADLKENLGKIHRHGERASSIVKGMLQHSRTGTGEKELTDLNAIADEYLRLAYHGLRAQDHSFKADFKLYLDESLPKVNVVPQDIGRVLLNLINNAFHAVREVENPLVTVTTTASPLTEGGLRGVQITVSDNGPGIPDEIKDKIFQPFFTTKATGQGTGLGLSMSYDIITKGHGGTISLTSQPEPGCCFKVTLPI